MRYCDFKTVMRLFRSGVNTHMALLTAHLHDSQLLDVLRAWHWGTEVLLTSFFYYLVARCLT